MILSVRLRYLVGALLMGAAFYWLVVFCVGYADAIPIPRAWRTAFPMRRVAFIAWAETFNTLAMIIAAIPVLVVARFLFGRHALFVSAVASLVAVAVGVYSSLDRNIWPLLPGVSLAYLVVDSLKMLVILPLLIWVVDKLPSNYRMERPRES